MDDILDSEVNLKKRNRVSRDKKLKNNAASQ